MTAFRVNAVAHSRGHCAEGEDRIDVVPLHVVLQGGERDPTGITFNGPVADELQSFGVAMCFGFASLDAGLFAVGGRRGDGCRFAARVFTGDSA